MTLVILINPQLLPQFQHPNLMKGFLARMISLRPLALIFILEVAHRCLRPLRTPKYGYPRRKTLPLLERSGIGTGTGTGTGTETETETETGTRIKEGRGRGKKRKRSLRRGSRIVLTDTRSERWKGKVMYNKMLPEMRTEKETKSERGRKRDG
jgi:hypothetical protein